MRENSSKTRTCPSQAKKYPQLPKISSGCLPVSSINSVHINIYTGKPLKAAPLKYDNLRDTVQNHSPE